MKVPEKIPEWLAALPGDANLSAKEVALLFEAKPINVIDWSHRGNYDFPKNDVRFTTDCSTNKFGRITKVYWRASTIRNFIRQHNLK